MIAERKKKPFKEQTDITPGDNNDIDDDDDDDGQCWVDDKQGKTRKPR